MFSDLQVDVNGQETFCVNMKLFTSFSGKLRKMFTKPATVQTRNLKLILHDFPGGPDGFELILRFCYNGGRVDITPSNILLLHSAAEYLEINESETKKYYENVHFWTWSELLDCLKQSQELLPFVSSSFIVQEILNAVVEKVSMLNISSPFAFSSSDYSSTRFSGDVSTNYSSSFQTRSWLQDLEFLTVDLFEKMLSSMFLQKVDRRLICSFLLHYQKVKFASLSPSDKCRIIEVVVSSLCSKNGVLEYFPFRSLCGALQVCSTLNMGRCWVKKVEKMIGFRLDEATLDDLMVPSCSRKRYAYDVDFVLRLLEIFLGETRKKLCVRRLKKVGFLMDLYLNEVAADPYIKPYKFLALVLALPDSARESCDKLYEIIDMYFKVHRFISEEEKINICSVLNYEKLSIVSLVNIAENIDFPACVANDALVILQSNLSKNEETSAEIGRSFSFSGDEDEQIMVHEGKKCRKGQKFSENIARISVTCPRSGRSLPILCS